MMKKLITIAALAATVFAAPALARTSDRAESRTTPAWTQSYAQAGHSAHSANPAFDVYDTNGHYVGSDPDANVRMMLQIDGRNEN
jgi:hypothetical protein